MSYQVESAQVRAFADVVTEVSGRRLDGVHAVIIRRIDAALKTAVGRLDEGAEKVRAAADTYDEMEADGQADFDGINAA